MTDGSFMPGERDSGSSITAQEVLRPLVSGANHRMAMSLKACPWQFPMQTRTCAIKGDAEKPWTSILPFPHKAKTEPNPNSVPEHSAQVERVLFGP